MTRLISKKQAIRYKTETNKARLAVSLLYALRSKKRITKEEFNNFLPVMTNGRLFYQKKLTGKR